LGQSHAALRTRLPGRDRATNFIPPELYGRRHLVYLTHYAEPDDRAWNAGAEEIVEALGDVLRPTYSELDRSWIKAGHVSRDRRAQPVPLAGGPMPGLPPETGLPGLFHASLAHIYPDDRGISQALRLGRRAVTAAAAWLSESEQESEPPTGKAG